MPKKPKKKPARKPSTKTKKKKLAARWKVPKWKKDPARTSGGSLPTMLSPRQLVLAHVPPPPPVAHTPEELRAATVQTLRVGRLRADRWQLAASNERRAWAVWASMVLDAACDALGLPALPKGAR